MIDTQKIMDGLDPDEICQYCIHRRECSGDIHGGPNGPIYPPCADGFDEYDIDLEKYLRDLGDEDET